MGPKIRPARETGCVFWGVRCTESKTKILEGPGYLPAWLCILDPIVISSQDNPGAQKSAPLQCRGQEVLHFPSAFFSHCWLCTVLKGATLHNAGLSTSSASRDQGWQFRGLEYPSGATTEVRNKRGLAMPRVLQSARGPLARWTEGGKGAV